MDHSLPLTTPIHTRELSSPVNLLECFDGAYVVNLPNRVDRRRKMEHELQMFGIAPANGAVQFFTAIRPSEARGFPSIGAYGCFRSHLTILKQAVVDGARRVLIMEDDLMFAAEMRSKWQQIAAALDNESWDIAYFGFDEKQVEPATGESAMVLCRNPLEMTHFYAVNGRALPELIAFLEEMERRPAGHPLGGPMHYDGALTTYRQQHPERITLRSVPCLGFQRPSRSDIAGVRWFDHNPLLRRLSTWLRAAKGEIVRR